MLSKDGGFHDHPFFLIGNARNQDQESWKGSSGTVEGDVDVYVFKDQAVQCRRAHLYCQGTKRCEFFDDELLKDHKCYEPNRTAMQKLFEARLDVNERDERLPDAQIAR